MATYEKCGFEVNDLVTSLYTRNHAKRVGHDDVRVGCLWYRAKRDDDGNVIGPPLKLHGVQAAAIIRVVSYKDRVAGLADAQIVIDEDTWELLNGQEREALVDHELEHIDLKRTKKGGVALDDADRPKLKLRNHDWDLGGFRIIVERHGTAALEQQGMEKVAVAHGQLLFPWAVNVKGGKWPAKTLGKKAEEFFNPPPPPQQRQRRGPIGTYRLAA